MYQGRKQDNEQAASLQDVVTGWNCRELGYKLIVVFKIVKEEMPIK